MIHIVIDDQQAKLLSEADECVEIRDRQGNHLGFVSHGFSQEDIRIARERLTSDQPRMKVDEILANLRSMETK